jgi:hypothetical protein
MYDGEDNSTNVATASINVLYVPKPPVAYDSHVTVVV